ncbi:MAG: di-heme oxidoredictase family protein [Acidobacteriota bacterium]
MRFSRILILGALAVGVLAQFRPDISRVWNDKDVETLEMPLAQRDRSPRHMSEAEYYKLKPRVIYRSYPAYVTGKEPPGYLESLTQKEPEVAFDPSKLHTKEDWIRAGKIVFESENTFFPVANLRPGGLTLPASATGWVSSDGTIRGSIPRRRYYIRKKGVLETGNNSCAGCHTRLMPDGSLVLGAQANFPNGFLQPPATDASEESAKALLDTHWARNGAPWIELREAFDKAIRAMAPVTGEFPEVIMRQGTSAMSPPRIPSLIGIADIRYLDATGLVRHRNMGDLMRYAILNEGLDTAAHYGDFQPGTTGFSQEEGTRFSDEQLYALGVYLYSLKPPPNPNPMNAAARHGRTIFQREGCIGCHTPPFYTNNKLTPAVGFQVPDDLAKSPDVMKISVGTDPTLALKTRRGTGFYKVPSLRGVWFRSAFGHGGQATSLEEWLDPARHNQDYVPHGFHRGPGPILGHPFGLKLNATDKADLIAFLKTL